jgi:hypothetical protein
VQRVGRIKVWSAVCEYGLAELEDTPRRSGPRTALTDEVIAEFLSATMTPDICQEQGVTHGSTRLVAAWLAREKKIELSHDWIARLVAVPRGPHHPPADRSRMRQ